VPLEELVEDRAAAFVDFARRYSELGWALIRAEAGLHVTDENPDGTVWCLR
jgi:hypothetical protein